VYLEDVLVRGPFGGYVWMVFLAQDVGSAFEGVMANPPTPFGVAVDFSDTGIDAEGHRRNEGHLTEIGAEARPEVVIEIGSTVKGSGVQRSPVSDSVEEGDDERQADDAQHDDDDDDNSPDEIRRRNLAAGQRHCSVRRLCVCGVWGGRGRRGSQMFGHGRELMASPEAELGGPPRSDYPEYAMVAPLKVVLPSTQIPSP
jgi:hypothetical protein